MAAPPMAEARFSETRESATEKRPEETTTSDDAAQLASQEQASSQPFEYVWAPDSPRDVAAPGDAPPSVPRRRSYTRTRDGVEVQGEVVVVEAWRRHTRVYGGGVCLACAESEQKRLAMGLGVVAA